MNKNVITLILLFVILVLLQNRSFAQEICLATEIQACCDRQELAQWLNGNEILQPGNTINLTADELRIYFQQCADQMHEEAIDKFQNLCFSKQECLGGDIEKRDPPDMQTFQQRANNFRNNVCKLNNLQAGGTLYVTSRDYYVCIKGLSLKGTPEQK